MRTVLLASMRHHTRRYVAASVAVVIGVAFVVVTGMLTGATRSGLTADVGAPVAAVDHVVTVDDPRDAARLMDGAAADGVRALVLGYAMEPVSREGVQLSRSADIAEASLEPGLQWQEVEDGRLPTAADEAVADFNAAKRVGVVVGDVLRIGSGRAATDVEVVGLVDSPAAMGADLYVPWPTLERFRDTLWADAVAWGGSAGLAERLVPDATVQTADTWVAERQKEISRGVDVITVLAMVFVAIAYFVAVLVIANTFSILFAQRLREFALLRCVGVTRRELRRSVRLEALALGVAASAAGVVVGAVLGLGLVALVKVWFADMGAPTIDLRWVVGACVTGVLVTVAAAWLPTRTVTRVPPLAALRPDTGPDVRSRAGRVRLGLAVVCVVGGSGLLTLALAAGSLPGVAVMLLGGMVAFVGVLLLGPWLVPGLLTAASRLVGRGPVARLAAGNAVRNPRRTATTAASLLVGVTLTTAILTGLASSRTGLDEAMDTDYPLDATLTAVDAPLDARFAERTAAVDGVEDVQALDGTIASVGGEALAVVGVDGRPEVVRGPTDLSPPDGTILLSLDVVDSWPARVAERALQDHELAVSSGGREHVLDVRLGPEWGHAGLVSATTLATLTADPRSVAVWVRATPGADAEDLDGDLAALAGSRAAVGGGYGDRAWVDLQVDVVTGAVVGLLGIAVLIALIGIANTLGLSVLERSRENALLRAMGLTRQQLRRSMAAEGLLISAVATALGTAIGLVFAWIGVRVMVSPLVDGVAMRIPVGQLLAIALVAALAGLAACVVPARKAARVTPAAGLALD